MGKKIHRIYYPGEYIVKWHAKYDSRKKSRLITLEAEVDSRVAESNHNNNDLNTSKFVRIHESNFLPRE